MVASFQHRVNHSQIRPNQFVDSSTRQRVQSPSQKQTTGPASKRRRFTYTAQASSVRDHQFGVSEPYRGPNSPVSGYRLWLPGGGLVHVHAIVEPTAVIEAAAVVQEGSRIGRNCHIGSGSVVGPDVSIGDGTVLGHQVAITHSSIGADCQIASGAKIGGEGFILRQKEDGRICRERSGQTFRVEIRDGVGIGVNSVVDRGSWRDTVIDKGAMIDTLVHVGHDSNIGRSCVICSHASVGNSSSLGDDIILGYGAAVKDHVSVAAKTRIAAKAGVVRDILEAGDYAGHPAMLAKEYKQQVAATLSAQRQSSRDPSASTANQQPASSELTPSG